MPRSRAAADPRAPRRCRRRDSVGTPSQVLFRAADTTHGLGELSALGFSCPNGITLDQPCTANITPTAGQGGTYDYACTIFCASGHPTMAGRLVIRNP